MSAYKTHDRDPLFFSEGLKLVWRNGEDTVGCGDMQHCPAQYCPPRALSSDDTSGTHSGHIIILPACVPACLRACLPACLSACLSIYLSVSVLHIL
jgi:hypothetical protein